MSSAKPAQSEEILLPNIGDLPPAIQETLRNFARVAKNATEEKNACLRRLQGLENLSQMLQEYQADNVRNQEQFKWYEIVLLRTEADLLRTKKKLQVKELENEKMRGKLRVKGQLPKEDEDLFIVRDMCDGKTEDVEGGASASDETDLKSPSRNGSARGSRQKRLFAPVFVGISEDIHSKTLQELEETRNQLKELIKQDNITYKEFLDAKKSEVQIRELQKTIEQLTLENARKAEETAKDKGIDKDKHIMELEEEILKHREGDSMKVKVIEASNRRCQELKEELEEMRQKYQQQKENQKKGDTMRRRVSDPYQKDGASEILLQAGTREEASLAYQSHNKLTEVSLLDSYFNDPGTLGHNGPKVQCGDQAVFQRATCKRCNKLAEEVKRIREITLIVESEKSATVAQMKLFEDDFHKVREQLKFNEEKHQKEMSDSMKNCQMLSQELDASKVEMQKVRDHNQALEYQLSIVREYMKDHRPYYSVDSHPVARSQHGGPVYNPSAAPWQEGYRAPRRALDIADSRQVIEADSAAFSELKGEESEEEAELTRR
ncbi:hypothetical protein BSL78_14858 [Apostichopus japonicus]|uniref:Uncharacterized protein n=1 Tax=Stichopus japonicus TaxID=307972 RepID=A0A2G8KJU6_STIJA|nr:hypothetical protein BSL78_14858 [Apostichopus japonicus]